jgi:NAD(P)-dependent dehydrogenase (short-subunit alcohol dehydrogenase family)
MSLCPRPSAGKDRLKVRKQWPATGKVILLAGGTWGRGRGVALRFLEDSFATIVRARSLEGYALDVTNEDAVR